MRMFRPSNLFLPAAVVSLVGTGVLFMQPSLWTIGRWPCLALLGVFVLARGSGGRRMATPIFLAMAAYVLWCFATVFWSQVPGLSGAKLVALLLTGFSAAAGSRVWLQEHPVEDALDFLWPCLILTLVASVGQNDTGFLAGGI